MGKYCLTLYRDTRLWIAKIYLNTSLLLIIFLQNYKTALGANGSKD